MSFELKPQLKTHHVSKQVDICQPGLDQYDERSHFAESRRVPSDEALRSGLRFAGFPPFDWQA